MVRHDVLFCGKSPGTRNSLCSQFLSRQEDGVRRFVVTPRCDSCAEAHRKQHMPSVWIVVACAVAGAALGSLVRPWLAVFGLIAGVALGVVLASRREARAAKRPRSHVFQHEGYVALHGEAENWREDVAASTGRMETVDDFARHFADDPESARAVEAAHASAL
jgi:membrane protein implicated in regulation of membrane protease activity